MRLPLTAILAATGLAATGCMEEEAAMFIEGALPLAPSDCQVSAGDNVFLPSGTLDLGRASGGYTGFLKVRTNLPATFNNQDVQQDQTRSPNFPDYGAVDNNVVIFETAEVTFRIRTDAETLGAIQTAASQVAGGNLECRDGVCGSPLDPLTGKPRPEKVPAAGTVFNTQTQLNQPAVVTAELLSGAVAQTLKKVYEAAIALDSGDDALNARNLLDVPGETQRVELEVVLVGRTTGSQNLRTVRSAPFPFGVDICIGCLEPDAGLCRDLDAAPFPIEDAQTCLAGQDFRTAVCVCADPTSGAPILDPEGNPVGVVVNDRTTCEP